MIEVGEPLHTLFANAGFAVVIFLLGMQVGSLKSGQKNTD